MKLLHTILAIVFILQNVDCAKILGIFPMASYSHHTLGLTLMKALAEKGHEITFVNPYPQEQPIKNIKEISTAEIIENVSGRKKFLFEIGQYTFFSQTKFVFDMGVMFTRKIFNTTTFQEFIKSEQNFDVMIVENFVNEAFIGLGHHFNCPVIVLSPGPITFLNSIFIGNPIFSAYVPNILSSMSADMTLFERIKNVFYDIFGELFVHLYAIPKHNEIMQKYLPNVPHLGELITNVSLVLSMQHPSINVPYPLVPAVKEIAGHHITELKKLPKDLQEFMDKAKEGVILFSLGSNIKSADIPAEYKTAILNSFAKLKQKVLWKFETDLPGKPDNVKIIKWIPQNEILAHPNTKLFISHGGLLSTIEAVHFGVPMLGVPVYWDQKMNIKEAVNNGFAISVPYHELTEQRFYSALTTLLNDRKYTENVKARSSVLKDQPLKPMENAIFWIEHVIRHKGAHHLRSPALNLTWYQRSMLDIVIIIAVVTIMLYALFSVIIKHILGTFFDKKVISKSKKNK